MDLIRREDDPDTSEPPQFTEHRSKDRAGSRAASPRGVQPRPAPSKSAFLGTVVLSICVACGRSHQPPVAWPVRLRI